MILEVARPIPTFRTFDYICPDSEPSDESYWLGRRVLIPFGRFKAVGIVAGIKKTSDIPADRLKPVLAALDDQPLVSKEMVDLARWMADRYICSLGEALFALLPPGRDKSKPFSISAAHNGKESTFTGPPFTLTEDQSAAVGKLSPRISEDRFHSALLYGVAAAGKTEVYISLAEQTLKKGRRVLILAPEIGLVEQIGEIFRQRFGDQVILYHSDTSPKNRVDDWQRIRRGEVSIVIGPRAAALAPLENIGLIVIDEEQDSAFKEDRKPRFLAREVAEYRARQSRALLLFGGATPSLEILHRALQGEIEKVDVQTRAVTAPAPEIHLVDLRTSKAKGMLSPALAEAMGERFRNREQVILFLNKRGFFRYLRCPHCNWSARCPNCSIALVYHGKPEPGYKCHYCGHIEAAPTACPDCGKKELFAGGFGTERIESEVQSQFPWVHVARWDRDTASKRGAQKKIFNEFSEGKLDVLVGTQIVAQGLDFPNVTLVGVIDADGPLHIPDFRSPERAFQLITQVAGRSGRAQKPGVVYIQTRHPDHPAMHFAAKLDPLGFYRHEIKFREELGYPPFRNLIQVITRGKEAEKSAQDFVDWGESVGLTQPVLALGPTPVKNQKGRGAQFQVLFKIAPEDFDVFRALLRNRIEPSPAACFIDVEPGSLG